MVELVPMSGTDFRRYLEIGVEDYASLGAVRIGLNVMGWNHAARRLYEKAGFAVVGIGMTKFFS